MFGIGRKVGKGAGIVVVNQPTMLSQHACIGPILALLGQRGNRQLKPPLKTKATQRRSKEGGLSFHKPDNSTTKHCRSKHCQ